MTIFYLALAIVSGLCMAFQSPTNATLSRHVGNLQATCVSFGGGAICLLILMLIIGTGDISLVGPRPVTKRELEDNYTEPQIRALTSIRPGLTGYWHVSARTNSSYETGDRQKVKSLCTEMVTLIGDMKTFIKQFNGYFLRENMAIAAECNQFHLGGQLIRYEYVLECMKKPKNTML